MIEKKYHTDLDVIAEYCRLKSLTVYSREELEDAHKDGSLPDKDFMIWSRLVALEYLPS